MLKLLQKRVELKKPSCLWCSLDKKKKKDKNLNKYVTQLYWQEKEYKPSINGENQA